MRLSSIITILSVSFAAAKDLTKNERHSARSASHAFEMSADELHELLEERNSSSSKPAKNLSSSIETGIDSSCRDSPRNWYDADGFDCDWYSVSNRCYLYGNNWEFQNFGMTADEACCACGGGAGGGGNNYPTCKDTYNWYDDEGYDCDWYAMSDRCATFGYRFKNKGKTANQACCACGGGGGGGGGNNYPTCEDSYGWKDSWSETCSYYAIGNNCEKYGNRFRNYGQTADDACCACGGGNVNVNENERNGAKVKKPIIMTKEERDAHSKMKTH
jgi:hypothetical protein